jgi:hypothetical protein
MPDSMRRILARTSWWCMWLAGCSAIPDVVHQPQYHNPFPQLSRVAVLPFYNQSADPTVDSDAVAMAYYNELQAVRGFEVVPVGVARLALLATGTDPRTPEDFRQLAQLLGVDAVVVGAVTEYSPYYPPRMGLSVRWYAANPNFHPVPPGYGLPWGTPREEFIPESLVFESEFALAREQLRTQTPAGPRPGARRRGGGSGTSGNGREPRRGRTAPATAARGEIGSGGRTIIAGGIGRAAARGAAGGSISAASGLARPPRLDTSSTRGPAARSLAAGRARFHAYAAVSRARCGVHAATGQLLLLSR